MKNNKKGFTIVELVIVIAVIAILAAVLIPTFSTVIENANRSAALQEAKASIEMVAMEEDASLSGKYYIISDKYVFEYDADQTGITNSKPKTNKKEFDKEKVEDVLYLIISGNKAKFTSGAKLEYYGNTLTGAQDLAGDTVTLVEVGTEETPKNFTANEDISKNVIIVGVDNGK